jgi:4-diphosphocytidyl-2-C-methyl-D-erythritol kinase
MPTLLAPAKINVTLEVLARREDGYHSLRSVMLPLGLYDRIDIEPAERPAFESSDPALAGDNIVVHALERCGLGECFSVRLHKRIPVGGGLGGGSSDAAAILRAAMDGRLGPHDERDWIDVARRLGSDVPFFLAGTGALVEGTGDRVTPLGSLPPWWVVVVRPHASVPTADAYARLDAVRAGPGNVAGRPRATSASLAAVDALQRRDFGALEALLTNDFHDVILAAYPGIARASAAMTSAGASRSLLSGSGSCLFALFEDEAAARAVAAALEPAAIERCFTVPFHLDPAWTSPSPV